MLVPAERRVGASQVEGTEPTKFVIFLEGGGECVDAAACDAQQNTSLASSDYFVKSRTLENQDYYFLADGDAGRNPDLHGWTRVYVPYCSQDLWTGQKTKRDASTFGYYFSGHLNLVAVSAETDAGSRRRPDGPRRRHPAVTCPADDPRRAPRRRRSLGRPADWLGPAQVAILDALDEWMTDATDIVLQGASAGGIGVWPHLDFLKERYPAARVVGAPVAGFYFDAFPYEGPNHTRAAASEPRDALFVKSTPRPSLLGIIRASTGPSLLGIIRALTAARKDDGLPQVARPRRFQPRGAPGLRGAVGFVRSPRGPSLDESRRRRGCDVEIPWR